MTTDKNFEKILSGDGPEFDVWVHLTSGLDQARWELDSLPEKIRTLLARFGEHILLQRTNLTVAPDDTFAELSQDALEFPWLKFAADLAFAEEAVGRATEALDRYIQLQPILTRYKLGNLAAKYLREAGRTFLFAFDAACVAFCSAALEQTLRDTLVDAGTITQRELQRDRPTAFTLLAKARQAKLLGEAAEQAASDLIAKRNTLMHRQFDSLKDEVLKAMELLGVVLQELGRLRATDA
jgi:hypothetical protein